MRVSLGSRLTATTFTFAFISFTGAVSSPTCFTACPVVFLFVIVLQSMFALSKWPLLIENVWDDEEKGRVKAKGTVREKWVVSP